jgi:hypothetical protein
MLPTTSCFQSIHCCFSTLAQENDEFSASDLCGAPAAQLRTAGNC